jgi:hypothetical protein
MRICLWNTFCHAFQLFNLRRHLESDKLNMPLLHKEIRKEQKEKNVELNLGFKVAAIAAVSC